MDDNLYKKLKNLNIAIASHVYTTGPAQELEEYLMKKVKNLFFIGHPLFYHKDTRSFYKIYHQGILKKKKNTVNWRLPEFLGYIKDSLYSFFWLSFLGEKFDLYIGCNNLNSFIGILLRRLGKVKKVVFYTIDYVPRRFKNKLLNNFYHWVDRYCVKHADMVWNVSPRITLGRKEKHKNYSNKFQKQIVVPLGVWFDRIKRLPENEINRQHIAFMGHLTKKQGVQLLIDSFLDVIKNFPYARLVIIGSGPYEKYLKEKTKKLGLEKHIEFTGFLKDHRDVENRLVKCGISVAPYNPKIDTFTYYSDPGKVKNYLAAGLPIIITRLPHIAEVLDSIKAGIAVNYNKDEFVNAITNLLIDKNKYLEYRKNAINFARDYDWNKVFKEALKKTLELKK